MSYRMLHVIAYLDSEDIPHELIAGAACSYNDDDEDNEDLTRQASQLELLEAVARLNEFSFLRPRQTDDGGRSYEMHELVQEAVRYGLRISRLAETTSNKALEVDDGSKSSEAYYCGRALQVVDDLFSSSERDSWARCEQYLTHALRVGEWAEVSGRETETASLFRRVSYFLYDRGRWSRWIVGHGVIDARCLERSIQIRSGPWRISRRRTMRRADMMRPRHSIRPL